MKESILKYCLCYWIEKHHRFVFDNCYIAYEDKNYKSLTFYQKFRMFIYNKILYYLIKDFREYLRWWHDTKKGDYVRYNKYKLLNT